MRKTGRILPQEIPGWLNAALVCGTLATIMWLEKRQALRQQTENQRRRDTRNLAMAVLSAITTRCTERPVTRRLTHLVEQKQWGLVKRLQLPVWLEVLLSVVLLDYTLYLWHVLTHKVPWLWRFHQVHHVDLDLSTTTALRFHCIEMMLSVPWRAAQVVALGISSLGLSVWQTTTLLAILFHHSNIHLPLRVERWLCRFIVTPRMHGIHHSIVREETDANWATILAFPDYLHKTLKLNVPQQAITIGIPAYRQPQELTLVKILAMPFRKQRPSWQIPSHGKPGRASLPAPPATLER